MLDWLVIGGLAVGLGLWGYKTYTDPDYDETYLEYLGRAVGTFLGSVNKAILNVKAQSKQEEEDEG